MQVPLETLSSELHAHLGALKNKLVEVGTWLASTRGGGGLYGLNSGGSGAAPRAASTAPSTATAGCSHLRSLRFLGRQVINDDFNDFVSLSTKLVNVDGSLQRMQAPLLELQAGPLLLFLV